MDLEWSIRNLIEELADDFISEEIDEIKEEFESVYGKEDLNLDNLDDFLDEYDLSYKLNEFLDCCWYTFLKEDCFDDFKSEFLTCAAILDSINEDYIDTEVVDPKADYDEQIISLAFAAVLRFLEELVREKLTDRFSDEFCEEHQIFKEKTSFNSLICPYCDQEEHEARLLENSD